MGAASGQDGTFQAMLTLSWLTLAASAGESPQSRGTAARLGGRQPRGGGAGGLGSGRSLLTRPFPGESHPGPRFCRPHNQGAESAPGAPNPASAGAKDETRSGVGGRVGTVAAWAVHTPREGPPRLRSGQLLSRVKVGARGLLREARSIDFSIKFFVSSVHD